MNAKTILSSFGILPDEEKKFTFAMHSHKILTPTGTPVPDEKVKELSSNDLGGLFTPAWRLVFCKTTWFYLFVVFSMLFLNCKTLDLKNVLPIQGSFREDRFCVHRAFVYIRCCIEIDASNGG